ncbi:MAG: hypothetical protein ACREC5_05120, partial [Thermoplasmata archaeon]
MLEKASSPERNRPGALREDLARYFEDHRKLVETEALTLLLTANEPVLLARRLIFEAGAGVPFVTVGMVSRALAPSPPPLVAGRAAPAGGPVGARPSFELLQEGFSPPGSAREPLRAYQELFRSRFAGIHRMLKGRPELAGLLPVQELAGREGPAAVIGMIREVRTTSS